MNFGQKLQTEPLDLFSLEENLNKLCFLAKTRQV